MTNSIQVKLKVSEPCACMGWGAQRLRVAIQVCPEVDFWDDAVRQGEQEEIFRFTTKLPKGIPNEDVSKWYYESLSGLLAQFTKRDLLIAFLNKHSKEEISQDESKSNERKDNERQSNKLLVISNKELRLFSKEGSDFSKLNFFEKCLWFIVWPANVLVSKMYRKKGHPRELADTLLWAKKGRYLRKYGQLTNRRFVNRVAAALFHATGLVGVMSHLMWFALVAVLFAGVVTNPVLTAIAVVDIVTPVSWMCAALTGLYFLFTDQRIIPEAKVEVARMIEQEEQALSQEWGQRQAPQAQPQPVAAVAPLVESLAGEARTIRKQIAQVERLKQQQRQQQPQQQQEVGVAGVAGAALQ